MVPREPESDPMAEDVLRSRQSDLGGQFRVAHQGRELPATAHQIHPLKVEASARATPAFGGQNGAAPGFIRAVRAVGQASGSKHHQV